MTRATGVAVVYNTAFEQNPGGREREGPSRAYVFQKEGAGSARALCLESAHQIRVASWRPVYLEQIEVR